MNFNFKKLDFCDFCLKVVDKNNKYFMCFNCKIPVHKNCLSLFIQKLDNFICSKCLVKNSRCRFCNFKKGLLFKNNNNFFHLNCLFYYLNNDNINKNFNNLISKYRYCNICKIYDNYYKKSCKNYCHSFHIRCLFMLKIVNLKDLFEFNEICYIENMKINKFYKVLTYYEYDKINQKQIENNNLNKNILKNENNFSIHLNKDNKLAKIITKKRESMDLISYFGMDKKFLENFEKELVSETKKLLN